LEDVSFIEKTCLDIISENQYRLEIPNKDVEVICADSPRGAEYHAVRYFKKHSLKIKLFRVDWDDMTAPVIVGSNYYGAYNKLAAKNNNTKMIEYLQKDTDFCFGIVFDSGTPETKDVVAKLKKAGVRTYNMKQNEDLKWICKIWNP